MKILIEIPDSDIPKKQEIITVPIHFIDGIVCEAGGFGFDIIPKGHGRLIDADELYLDIQTDEEMRLGEHLKWVKERFDNASTIIEASKEAEDDN